MINYQYKTPYAIINIEKTCHAEAHPSSLIVMLHITSISGAGVDLSRKSYLIWQLHPPTDNEQSSLPLCSMISSTVLTVIFAMALALASAAVHLHEDSSESSGLFFRDEHGNTIQFSDQIINVSTIPVPTAKEVQNEYGGEDIETCLKP